jgi:flagellin-like protein
MKGISNVITTALLLAISVSIAGLYASWAPQFSQNITENAANQNQENMRCDNAGISIQNPTYYTGSKIVVFNVRNTGTIRFTDPLEIAVFNGTRPMNRTTVSELEVGESDRYEIFSSKKVSRVLATSSECPDVGDNEERVALNS